MTDLGHTIGDARKKLAEVQNVTIEALELTTEIQAETIETYRETVEALEVVVKVLETERDAAIARAEEAEKRLRGLIGEVSA